MKMAIVFDVTQRLDQRNRMVESPPLTGVPRPHHVEAAGSKIIKPRERRFEFPAAIFRIAGAISLNKTISSAVPFPIEVHGIVERRGSDKGEEPRFQGIGYELVTGSNDRFLFIFGCRSATVLRRPDPSVFAHGAFLPRGGTMSRNLTC